MTLQIEALPVDLIDPNPWNPNQQSEVVARATRESLEHYDFVSPISVRPHPDVEGRYQIVNGEHRWKEATGLGHETVPGVILDLTDEQAKKLTVVLNETTGDPDVVRLGQLLATMAELPDFRVGLPYSDAELEHLLLIGRQNWDERDDTRPPPPVVETRDVVIALTPEQRSQFDHAVVALRDEYGHADLVAVVLEAMRRAAHRANQE